MPYLEKLKEYRESLGLTQKELGAKVGVSEASISNYETGKREPEFVTLCALADLFDISLDMLVRGKEKDRPEERSVDTLVKVFRLLPNKELRYLSANIAVTLAERELPGNQSQDGKQ